MSERRFGRVTVEGWIDDREGIGMHVVDVYQERGWRPDGGAAVRAVFYNRPGDVARVEFLPEPVVFADGDVVRFRVSGSVAVRIEGQWVCHDLATCRHDDDYVKRALDSGRAVRLVPEGGK